MKLYAIKDKKGKYLTSWWSGKAPVLFESKKLAGYEASKDEGEVIVEVEIHEVK